MEAKYEFIVIRSRKTKSANIYCKLTKPSANGNELYLARSGMDLVSPKDIVERIEGGEMPLFAVLPDEQMIPFLKAAREEYGER